MRFSAIFATFSAMLLALTPASVGEEREPCRYLKSFRASKFALTQTKAIPCLPVGSSTRPVRGLTQCNREHAIHFTD